jgi:hypothetical protein
MDRVMDMKDLVTVGLAAVGAVLGVLNTWKSLDRDRPKLLVVPKFAFAVGPHADDSTFVCFDVTNLSTFPLTVTEVGFLYWWTRRRAAIPNPIVNNGPAFPRELTPRTSVSAYTPQENLAAASYRIRCAYVKTDCGLIFTGNSPALRGMVKQSRTR